MSMETIARDIAANAAKGLTAQELREYIAFKYGDRVLAKLNAIPRKNIREFIQQSVGMYGAQPPFVDVGCGYRTNFLEVELSLGVALTPTEYVAFDQVLYSRELDQHGQSLVASALRIPLPNKFAGTILCTEILEHVSDEIQAAAEIARVIRVGGTLLVSMPGVDIPKHEKPPYQIDYRRFDLQTMGNLFVSVGFEVLHLGEKREYGYQTNIFLIGKK